MTSSQVIPGQAIGSTSTHTPGPGTHVYESKIVASIIGSIVTTPAASKKDKPTISVPRSFSSHSLIPTSSDSTLPVIGSTVLARVIRVQQRQAVVSVILVNPSSASASVAACTATTNEELQFQAVLRREDVRAYEKDKVVMNEMFRVGDVIKATVISLGDERQYYISTSGNEFGVVVARSEDDNAMVPSNWKEMKDAITGKSEARKVAKPA